MVSVQYLYIEVRYRGPPDLGDNLTDVAVDGEAYEPFAQRTWNRMGNGSAPAIDGLDPCLRLPSAMSHLQCQSPAAGSGPIGFQIAEQVAVSKPEVAAHGRFQCLFLIMTWRLTVAVSMY